jgi:hypothetical protein
MKGIGVFVDKQAQRYASGQDLGCSAGSVRSQWLVLSAYIATYTQESFLGDSIPPGRFSASGNLGFVLIHMVGLGEKVR